MGITAEALSRQFPFLYHMAEAASWPSIEKYGLLSTSALLDLFKISGPRRVLIEAQHRSESIKIRNTAYGVATIRDQKPMSDNGLIRCLKDDLTPSQWYKILNEKVFFWLSYDRLMRLVNAKAYRNRRHCVLTINTAQLLKRHSERVVLSPINSGCTKPYPHPRGRNTFLPMAEYQFDYWSKKRNRKDPIVELAVRHSVPDLREFIVNVKYMVGS